jgi:23S rRNA G2069 N7-methylase RlmK/C1962 C5-methylase RlmI
MLPTVKLKPGREKPLLRRHPWIFSGAIGRVDEDIANGQTVEVVDSNGNFLAKGAFSPQSQIRVRVWSWDSEVPVKEGFFRGRLSNAFTARQDILDTRDTDAYRLVHGESDGLPGLIVDRYGDCLVVQSLSSGSEYWLETIVDLLVALTGDKRIYERSDADVRELEGLPQRAGRLYPSKSGLWQTGESDSAIVEIIEWTCCVDTKQASTLTSAIIAPGWAGWLRIEKCWIAFRILEDLRLRAWQVVRRR